MVRIVYDVDWKCKRMLRVNQLSYSYGDKPVLHGVELNVKENEIVSIIGHNGAGKTTLLKCIFGVLNGVKGGVQFLDNQIANVPPYSSSRRYLPAGLLKEPLPDGPHKGATVPMDELLNEGYKAFGWDVETGV